MGERKSAEPQFALFSHLWSPSCLLGCLDQKGQEDLFLWVTNQKAALESEKPVIRSHFWH